MSIAEAAEILERAEEVEWPEPEPILATEEDARPYPLDALPPVMRKAVETYQRYGQQPLPLVACSALANASLAAQGLVDVGRDENLIGPVSLNLAVIACSGERKTSADRRFAAAAQRWQAERSEAMEPEMAAARAAIDAHAAERDGIIAKIRRAAGKASGKDQADRGALQARLEELEATRPSPVIPPCLFREDASPEALAQGLAFGWPSSSVWSDEGGLVVGGHGMSEDSALRYLALLNRLWDGLAFRRDRTTTQSFVVQGRRLTCSLMMQELVLARLMAARNGAARGIGFLARFLLAWPMSTMGMRRYREADLSAPELAAFDQRMHELLDLPLPTDRPALTLRPEALFLSQAARRQWIAFHDDVEQELGRNGAYGDVCDFAAKAAEKAARIAAVLHVFEHGPRGEIQADALLAGAQIAAWHLHEARRIMAACERPQLDSDAHLLLQWLVQQEPQPVSLKRVSQYAPSRVRPKQRRDRAIEELQERHLVVLDRFEGTAVLRLNPRLRGDREPA